MSGILRGKSALITGGGGGIGRATALAFAREGCAAAAINKIFKNPSLQTLQSHERSFNGLRKSYARVDADEDRDLDDYDTL